MGILPILGHEEATERDIEGGSVALQLLSCDCGVLGTGATVISTAIVPTLEQVPVGSDEELFSFFELGASHPDIGLCEDEVRWQQLNRLLVEDFLLDCLAHGVIDDFVCVFVLVVNDVLLGLLDRHCYVLSLFT